MQTQRHARFESAGGEARAKGGQGAGKPAPILILDSKSLKAMFKSAAETHSEDNKLRIHRAISWLGRAETARDIDSQFIFRWIAFNAAYGREINHTNQEPTRKAMTEFFAAISKLDRQKEIYKAVWDTYSGPVKSLIPNKYVFKDFWESLNGAPGSEKWKENLERRSRAFSNKWFRNGETPKVLYELFDRMYTLRNQIVHGGATWNSKYNRDQVRDSRNIMETLLPIFIRLMIDNPDEDWGRPYYPVVNES